MADIRINALATTATTPASDDFLALDGTAQGTRKILATNIANNVTDVVFGTSGPSAKSSIAARAARQGLVFDGTAGATVSGIPAFGTGDFTVAFAVKPSSLTATQAFIGGATNSFALRVLLTSGYISASKVGVGDATNSTGALTAGKWAQVAYTRTGTSGTYYINGVSAGTTTDAADYSVACTQIGSQNTTPAGFANGQVIPLAVVNRALTAAEVVSLYEAGVPSGADYNNASNTANNTSNFVNGGTGYGTFDGASATGFHVIKTAGTQAFAGSRPVFSVAAGRRFLATFTATLTSGVAPSVLLGNSISGAARSGASSVAAGSNSVVLTATSTDSAAALTFYNNPAEAAEFTISSVSVTPLGLLLAPDAAQAGGGLTWYDTSGNAANITLPASGVSWNVPSSRVLGGDWTISGTGTSTFAGSAVVGGGALSGTEKMMLRRGSAGYTLLNTDGTTIGGFYVGSGLWLGTNTAHPLEFYTNGSGTQMRLATTGNLIIGSPFTDGGQKLQVNGTAYVSSDITSGSIIRSSGATNTIRVRGNSQYVDFTNLAENAYVNGTIIANTLSLVGNNGTGLSIGATGDATFAGTVITPAATTAISSVRLPHGTAPTSPVNGDMWTTTAGLYVRINGVTVGPLS